MIFFLYLKPQNTHKLKQELIGVKKKISEYVADTWGVPKDVIMDIPRITISGDREIYIEHHKGVSLCKKDEIRIVTSSGEVSVGGINLEISAIRPEDILVIGEFRKIEYRPKNK